MTRSKPQVAKNRTHKLSWLPKNNNKRYKINNDANASTNSNTVSHSGNNADMDDNKCSKTEGSTSNGVTDNVNADIPDPNDEPMTSTVTTVMGSNPIKVIEPSTQSVQTNNNNELGAYSDSTINYEHSEKIPENANTEVTLSNEANSNNEHS